MAGGPAARARRARRRVDPALQLRGHPGPDPGQHDERARDERARRHRSSSARSAPPPGSSARVTTHGISPEVDPEEWPHARYLLVWGWNPMSTAPHLWRKLLEARRAGARLVVVDPFRSRTARVADEHLRPLPGTDAALAIGMMRAVVDAGLQDEDWCRAHAEGYDELLARARATHPVERVRGDLRRPTPRRSRAWGASSPTTRPALLRLGVGAQRHLGAPAAYSTIASLPALTGAWRDARRRLLVHPDRPRRRPSSSQPARARRPAPGPGAHDQHVPARRRAHRPRARPPGEGARVLELEPGRDRARPGARARGAAPRGPVHASCSSSS